MDTLVLVKKAQVPPLDDGIGILRAYASRLILLVRQDSTLFLERATAHQEPRMYIRYPLDKYAASKSKMAEKLVTPTGIEPVFQP
jgi:hypothetical protein